jgi:hypothetical protein
MSEENVGGESRIDFPIPKGEGFRMKRSHASTIPPARTARFRARKKGIMKTRSRGMRTIVLSVVLMATGSLALAAQAGAAASTVTTQVTSEIPPGELIFTSCANGGAGEAIAVSGTLHEVFHTTVDNVGGFHLREQSNPQGVSGVGQVTGAKYQVTGGSPVEENLKTSVEVTSVTNFRIIGQGPDNNFVFHGIDHFTVNANGTVTASHLSFKSECK